MRLHRKILAVAAAGLCAFGVISIPAGTANADVGIVYTTDPKPRGGSARFFDNGDKVNVCDRDADGYSAMARTFYYKNGWYVTPTVKATGADSCVTVSHNVPESTTVILQVCLIKSGGDGKYCKTRDGKS